MEQDPEKINDADRALESKIINLGEFAAASNKRQKAENKLRAENRAKIKELGVGTYAYQVAVKVCKDMTEAERSDFLRDIQLLIKILGPRQQDLWADELIKAEKREQKKRDKAAKAGRTQAELDAKTDTDPKSDPAKGGAGKRKKKAAEPEPDTRPPEMRSSDPVIDASLKAVHDAEQAEGEKLLDGAGKPKSQSQIAAERLEAAGGGLPVK